MKEMPAGTASVTHERLRLRCVSDPPSADLEQLELPVLCDGLRRYLQDLPQPIIPTAVHTQMVHTAKGGSHKSHPPDTLCTLYFFFCPS